MGYELIYDNSSNFLGKLEDAAQREGELSIPPSTFVSELQDRPSLPPPPIPMSGLLSLRRAARLGSSTTQLRRSGDYKVVKISYAREL